MSYRPDNTSAYLQDVWLPSCNLKFRLQGLFNIRIIKFIAGTTLGRANYGWDNFRPGQLWLGQLWARPTSILSNYVWANFGLGNFGPDNNEWDNFELIPKLHSSSSTTIYYYYKAVVPLVHHGMA